MKNHRVRRSNLLRADQSIFKMPSYERKTKPSKNTINGKVNSNKSPGNNDTKLLNKPGPGNNRLIFEVLKKNMGKTGENWETMLSAMKSDILEGIRREINISLKEMESKVESKMEELISREEEKIIKSHKVIEQKLLDQCK